MGIHTTFCALPLAALEGRELVTGVKSSVDCFDWEAAGFLPFAAVALVLALDKEVGTV